MGYIAHHAIVVSSWNPAHIEQARAKSEELGLPTSGIVSGWCNGETSFFVAPDGSKEGWSESDRGDHLRAQFIAWLRSSGVFVSWVLVIFSPDSRSAAIEDHAWKREDT